MGTKRARARSTLSALPSSFFSFICRGHVTETTTILIPYSLPRSSINVTGEISRIYMPLTDLAQSRRETFIHHCTIHIFILNTSYAYRTLMTARPATTVTERAGVTA